MKKKMIGAIAIGALVAMTALAGCSNTADTKTNGSGSKVTGTIKIGYIVKRGTDSFASDQVNAAQAAAKKVGVELVTADVKQDTGLAISTLNQMIANGIQGLIIVVPDQAIGPQILSLAAAKHIPVLASDDPIKDSKGVRAPFIGLDGTALGKQAGEQLAKALATNSSATPATAALVVVSQNSVSACTERTDAAKKAFNAAGGDKKTTFIDVPHDGTLQTAVTAMSATITQNPGIKDWFITSCNDDGVAGALRALESKGVMKANSFGYGMDGSLACSELSKDNGFAAGNFVSFSKNGEIAFDTMYNLLKNGTKMPAQQSVPGPVINRDNKSTLGCK